MLSTHAFSGTSHSGSALRYVLTQIGGRYRPNFCDFFAAGSLSKGKVDNGLYFLSTKDGGSNARPTNFMYIVPKIEKDGLLPHLPTLLVRKAHRSTQHARGYLVAE
jgi:hypothetical protein